MLPIITLYIENTLKLPFFKNSNKNFITTIPIIKLNAIPIINDIIPNKFATWKNSINSSSLNIVAANTIGADSINEYFAVASLFTPIAPPVVIVTPDLETPGIKANAWDNPIRNVCLKLKSL